METKFWILDTLEKFLHKIGLNSSVADVVIFVVITTALVLIIKFSGIIIMKILNKVLSKAKFKIGLSLRDTVKKSKLLKQILHYIMILAAKIASHILYKGFPANIIDLINQTFDTLSVIFFTFVVITVIDIAHKHYNKTPNAQIRSIKGFIQTLKIMVWLIAILISFTIISGISLTKILTGLTAFAAVLMLVFKDSILGLVASIQISSNDAIRLGDWIATSDNKASGIVVDINLTYCKVKNWNNTITYVPIYNLVNQSYVNWREMYPTGGRKLVNTSVVIDTNFIKILSEDEFNIIKENELVKPYYEEMSTLCGEDNMSNLSLYRTYIECYIRKNESINPTMDTVMTYASHDGEGVKLSAYSYTTKTGYVNYEHAQCNLLEHMLSTATIFDIVICQRGTRIVPVVSENL